MLWSYLPHINETCILCARMLVVLAAAQSQYSRLVACTLILFDVIDFHFFKVIAYIFRRQHYRLLLMLQLYK